jgi:hypothetical protein
LICSELYFEALHYFMLSIVLIRGAKLKLYNSESIL